MKLRKSEAVAVSVITPAGLRWGIFTISALVLPMPYYLLMAAGTMPLLAYYLGFLYAAVSLNLSAIFLAIFALLNTFLLLFISKYAAKMLAWINKPKTVFSVLVIVFFAMAFIPWHWALGINGAENHNTFQLYQEVYKVLGESS